MKNLLNPISKKIFKKSYTNTFKSYDYKDLFFFNKEFGWMKLEILYKEKP